MDRYTLFNNLEAIFEKVDLKYKLTSKNGIGIDILDVLIASLYLAAIQARNGLSKNALPFRTLPFNKKIRAFHSRIFDRIKHNRQARKRNNIIRLDNQLTKADIVFFPVEPTHLLQQIPVAKILVENGIELIFVTNRTKIYNSVLQEGFNVHFMNVETNMKSNIDFNIPALCDQIQKNNLQDSRFTIDEEVIKFVIHRINYLTKEVLALIDSISMLLNSIKPRTVVVGNDFTVEGRATTRICQSMKINAACIMHGSVAGEPLDSLHIVDNYFVYGKRARDYLINLDVDEDKLVITGDPHIDQLKVREKTIHSNIKKKLHFNGEQGYVLLALSGPGHCTTYEHFNKIVESVVKLSIQEQEIDIVAKLHRKDKKDNYTKIMRKYPDNHLRVVEYGEKGFPKNIYDWLQGCKLVITGASTVAIEAMLMQIPVVTLDYMNEYQDVDFIDLGATVHVKTEAKLFEAAQNMFYSPEKFNDTKERATQYIESYYYKPNGKASERVADYLANI